MRLSKGADPDIAFGVIGRRYGATPELKGLYRCENRRNVLLTRGGKEVIIYF